MEHACIGRIYEAAQQPALWPPLLAELGALVDAGGVVAAEFGVPGMPAGFLHAHNTPGSVLAVFERCTHEHAAREPEGGAGLPVAVAVEDEPEAAVPFSVQVDGTCCAGAVLRGSHGHCVVLGGHRCASQPPFDAVAIARLRRLVHHVARAIRVQRQLGVGQQELDGLLAVLGILRTGVVLVDGSGRAAWLNESAKRLLRHHPGLRLAPTGQVVATDPLQQRQLLALLQAAISAGGSTTDTAQVSPAGILRIAHAAASQPLRVKVVPLAERRAPPVLSSGTIRAAMLITDPDTGRSVSPHYLSAVYGLTPTESAIANGILNGDSLSDLARMRNVSVETVRSHAKSVFTRTGERGQTALVRLMMSLAAEDGWQR